MNLTYQFPEDGVGPMLWIVGGIVVLFLIVWALTIRMGAELE